MKKAVIILAAALALIGAGFAFGRASVQLPEPSVVRDTIRIRDTITIDRPQYITQRITDTIELEVVTTRTQHDTVFASLPREEVRYEDSLYTAIVTGVQPRLEYLAVYPEKQIVTITETEIVPSRTRWGIGLQAGYGITPAGFQPYAGIGVSFDLFSW